MHLHHIFGVTSIASGAKNHICSIFQLGPTFVSLVLEVDTHLQFCREKALIGGDKLYLVSIGQTVTSN